MADPGLTQLHAKHLPHAFKPDLVAFCDPHDLIAIVSENGEVPVYRINGQIAFTVKRRVGEEANATAVSWKQDGSCLAIGWDDGIYGIYSGENGRIISQSSVRKGGSGEEEWRLDLAPTFGPDDDEEDGPVVKCFGWNHHLAYPRHDSSRTTSKVLNQGDISTEDWLDGSFADGKDVKAPSKDDSGLAELARAITTLDVTERIPKLSSLPAHGLRAGPDGSKFASQTATDNVFTSQQDSPNDALDTLLVCSSDGCVQMLTNETVKVGSCQVEGTPFRHSASSDSETQVILSGEGEELNANFINLPIDTLGGPLLSVIATNTKRIQNLLAYTTHTIRCMHHDLTTGLQFPTRLLHNINLELTEKSEEGSITLHLYHLALTGTFTPTLLEWLVDIIKETNHKRWDTSINTLYTNLTNHLTINLLPALDRLTIATTTLRGHARFHEATSQFDVAPSHFTAIISAIDCLRLVAQRVQLVVMREHGRFRAFSKWLRVMIDIGVAGPGGKTAMETEEREVPNLDFPLVLEYISETMGGSGVKGYVEPVGSMVGKSVGSREEFFGCEGVKGVEFEGVKRAVERVRDGEGEVGVLLNLPALAVTLVGCVRVAMEKITQWQSLMLREPEQRSVQVTGKVVDMTVDHLLILEEGAVVLQPLDGGASETVRVGGKVLSAAFLGRRSVLALIQDGGGYSIVQIAVATLDSTTIHTFAAPFTPMKLVVGGREDKRVLVVLEKNNRGWRVYDLDSAPKQEGKMKGLYVDDEDDEMSER